VLRSRLGWFWLERAVRIRHIERRTIGVVVVLELVGRTAFVMAVSHSFLTGQLFVIGQDCGDCVGYRVCNSYSSNDDIIESIVCDLDGRTFDLGVALAPWAKVEEGKGYTDVRLCYLAVLV
jgi:hypothetical protein